MSQLIRIPKRFYIDHYERGLPTPDEVRETKQHIYISSTDPHLESLRADAEFYADRWGPVYGEREYRWLYISAKATADAINKILDTGNNAG